MIWTVQPPSNDVRARAVSVAEAATIATVATVQAVRSSFIDILRSRTAARAIGRRHRCSAPNGQLFVVRPIATKLWFRDRSERPRRWRQCETKPHPLKFGGIPKTLRRECHLKSMGF